MPPIKIAPILFAVALAATVVAVAPLLSPAVAEVPEGGFVFNKRCGTCHRAEALMPRLMKLPDDAARQTYLDKFLVRHHARDVEERALIIDYLLRFQPR